MSAGPLPALSIASLRALSRSLRDGPLAGGISARAIREVTGSQYEQVESYLRGMTGKGVSPSDVAAIVDAVADTKECGFDPSVLLDLVLSGPDVPGIPTCDTAAVIHSLIEQANNEVLLVGYAVHNGEKLFARLAERMRQLPSLRVVFC